MTDILTPEAGFSALKGCYETLYEQCAAQNKKWNTRDTLSNLLGAGPAQRGQAALIQQVHADVTARIADLRAALEPYPAEERNQWAVQTLEFMLFYPPVEDRTLSLMLSALEWLAEPLLSLADTAALADLAQRYQKRVPKRMMLPNQQKLLKAMQKRACG